MTKFLGTLFASKKVSVWGVGYLGYTTILRLQSKGFFVNCFSFDVGARQDMKSGKYPYERMKQIWSLNGDIPRADLSKLFFCEEESEMFEGATVHVIALPAFDEESGKPENYEKLVDIFSKNASALRGSLILFQSAEKAGTVENHFIKPLKKAGVDAYFASAFRSDWSVEEFLSGGETRVIAANNKESLDVASSFFDILGVSFKTLGGIEEAEVYENAKNCLKYGVEAYFAQLSLAYPDVNINEVSAMIVKNLNLQTKRSGINLLKRKNTLHIDNLLAGQNGDYLSIIKETQSFSMSLALVYADILKQKKISSTTIIGLSVEGAKKDIRASLALLMCEYLHDIGVDVFVHDPYFSDEEIKELLPFAGVWKPEAKQTHTDAYVIMGSNPVFNYFTQSDLEQSGIFDAKIVIDGVGALKGFSFSSKTLYHQVGDGALKALLR